MLEKLHICQRWTVDFVGTKDYESFEVLFLTLGIIKVISTHIISNAEITIACNRNRKVG